MVGKITSWQADIVARALWGSMVPIVKVGDIYRAIYTGVGA